MSIKRTVTSVVAGLVAVWGVGVAPAPAASAADHYLHFNSRVIMVEDHTGAGWPVRASVIQWDRGTDASIRYGRCRAGAGCVRVYERRLGRNGTVGHAEMVYTSTTKHLNPVKVILNDSYRISAHQRRQAVQHELGHAFGLNYHSTSKRSCMYRWIANDVSMYPSAGDKRILNWLY